MCRRRRDYPRMVRQAQVVIGAEVDDGLGAPFNPDLGSLRRNDDPLALEQPGLGPLGEFPFELVVESHCIAIQSSRE